ncbi:MAG: hypothetical protein ACE5D6_06510, partial [Candidatus Zixiibacteriota bacterium]
MKTLLSKYIPLLSFTLILFLIIYGCTKKIIGDDGDNNIPIVMNAKLSSSELSSFISSFQLTVSAPDIDTIFEPLTLNGSVIEGQVSVQEGLDRKFVLEAIDSSVVIYRGDTTVDIFAGDEPKLDINMYPEVSLIRLSSRYLEISNDSLLKLNIRVFNLNLLHSLSVKVHYDSSIVRADSAFLSSNLNSNIIDFAALLNEDSAFYNLHIEHKNQSGLIVNDSGDADVATVFFSWPDTNIGRSTSINVEPLELTDAAGNQLDTNTIYTDSSLIDIVFYDTTLAVDKDELIFHSKQNSSNTVPELDTIIVTSRGADLVPFQVINNISWIELNNTADTTPGLIVVSVDSKDQGLKLGRNSGFITISSAMVPDPLEPTISITFFIDTIPPLPPVPVFPASNATDIPLDPTFLWHTSVNAQTYTLQIDTIDNFDADSSLVMNITTENFTDTTYTITEDLLYNTLYYWRVNAANGAGESEWSDIRTFTTIPDIPSPPVLASPDSGAVLDFSTDPTLHWHTSTGNVTGYFLELSSFSDFNSPMLDTSITDTFYSFDIFEPLLDSTSFYWRVKAVNLAGESDWSHIWNFVNVIDSIITFSDPALDSLIRSALGLN